MKVKRGSAYTDATLSTLLEVKHALRDIARCVEAVRDDVRLLKLRAGIVEVNRHVVDDGYLEKNLTPEIMGAMADALRQDEARKRGGTSGGRNRKQKNSDG